MRVGSRIKRLIGNLLRRRRAEDALDAELRAWVDERSDRNRSKGLSPEEARRQALIEVGGIDRIKEEVRAAWLGQGIETTVQNIRYACRSLLRSPGFTIVVAATLALGIGANLTMFSLMRAVLWRPLPYPEPDRIVTIQVDARNVRNTGASYGEVNDLRLRSHSLGQVSMISPVNATLEFTGEMERVPAASVSDNFLPLLGASPALGRALDSRADQSGDQALAILISDALWRRRFGADPGVIGRAIRVNNLEVQIVGVLAPGFRLFLPPSVHGEEQIDVWFPYAMSASRQFRGTPILARLRAGVTLDQANAELQTLVAQFTREYPDAYLFGSDPASLQKDSGKVRFRATPIHEEMTREARPALLLLAAAVGFVLLIACVNVANLMLARGLARQRDLAIRRALGAGRLRVIRQLLTESVLLAIVSAALGLLFARLGLAAVAHLGHSHIPLQSRIEIDSAVMAFALALSVVASALFGMLPAWRLASGRASDPLRAGRSETTGSAARRLHRVLVVAEVALSIVPLACGGLMLRSFVNLAHAPLGFNPVNVVTARAPLSLRRFPRTEQQWAWLRDVLDRVQSLPGVESVSAASPLPLAPDQEPRRVGSADQPDALPIIAMQQVAAPGYLKVIGTPLLQGRDFNAADITLERQVTIIDERLAKRLWPRGTALGQRLVIWRSRWRQSLEVIGITAAVRSTRVRDDDVPYFLMGWSLYPGDVSLVVKTRETAERMAPGIRRAVEAAQGGRPAFAIRPMSAWVSDSIGDTRFILFVLAAFASASLLLAAVGLYGTLAYLTAQRTREFGIRLALGSSAGAIMAIVIREGVLLALAGAVLGLAGASLVTRAIRELLYGVSPLDGLTLAGVVGLVAIVALGAAGVPARRATRADPQASLQGE